MSTRTTRTTKRAPRSKAVEQAPVPVAPPEPAKPSYARGNPLTHSVTFIDTSGMCWLVYVEPAPPQPALWPNAAVLPGRRLRFDSLDQVGHRVAVSGGRSVPPGAGAAAAARPGTGRLISPGVGPRGTGPDATARAQHAIAAVTPEADLPEPVVDPVRRQLTSMVNARSGWTYQLSRMVQPVTLVLVVIRDMILPRRG